MKDWRSFYSDIKLTPEEIEEAIFEAKKKKYFKEKNKPYWNEQEAKNKKDAKVSKAGPDGV